MSMKESRRDFLMKSSMLVGTAAVLGTSMIGCAQEPQVIEKEPEIPAYPYPCCEFDLDRVEKIGTKVTLKTVAATVLLKHC